MYHTVACFKDPYIYNIKYDEGPSVQPLILKNLIAHYCLAEVGILLSEPSAEASIGMLEDGPTSKTHYLQYYVQQYMESVLVNELHSNLILYNFR